MAIKKNSSKDSYGRLSKFYNLTDAGCLPIAPTPASSKMWEYVSSINVSNAAITSENFTGLLGDTYDYHLVVAMKSLGNNQELLLRLNTDSGTNYRKYGMHGASSTVSASVLDTATSLEIATIGTDTNYQSFAVAEITGSSGKERSVRGRYNGLNATTPEMNVINSFWKNTADELTAINLVDDGNSNNYTFDAYLFRRKKVSTATDGWEVVETVDFSSRDLYANPIDFTGLTGDTAKEYILEIEGMTQTGTENILIRFNNDAGSNYIYERLFNNAGALSAATATQNYILNFYMAAGVTASSKMHINAESGRKRLLTLSKSTTGQRQIQHANWWANTADELTSIKVLTTATSSVTGRAVLYKRASTESDLVSRDAIDGDFSAGKTWSSLTGNSDGIYEINVNLVDKGVDSGWLYVQFNGDTGANYELIRLYGYDSSAGALTATGNNYLHPYANLTSQTPIAIKFQIYPVSGKYRPVLITSMYGDGTSRSLQISGQVWKNTADEIISIKVYNSSSVAVKGEVSLHKIALS